MSFRRRRLYHWHPEGTPLFLTWHLHGSLPRALYPPPGKESSGKAFVWMDRYLDTAPSGPRFLAQDSVAAIVLDGLETGERLGQYELHAWVLMANHVHALLTPRVDVSRVTGSLKGATAWRANELLGRTGKPFWQAESYDHWVRNDEEFRRIWAYIKNNPVKAGLVEQPCAYRWSSAHKRPDESGRGSDESPRHIAPGRGARDGAGCA